MAESKGDPTSRDSHRCRANSACTVSLVSLLICMVAVIRVEIVNHALRDLQGEVVEIRRCSHSESSSAVEGHTELDSTQSVNQELETEGVDMLAQVRARRRRQSKPDDENRRDQLTTESIRSEINKTLNSLSPQSFCSPMEKICEQGPPGIQGPRGDRGPRGRRGPRGAPGRKGARGMTGPPGPHGKQGMVGPRGPKGDQGVKGDLGARGLPGIQGEPGESIAPATIVISPRILTVKENQSAIFHCSSSGNPQPDVMWVSPNVVPGKGRFRFGRDGKLEIPHVVLEDAGNYMCIGKNVFGSANQSAFLIVEAFPRIRLAAGPIHAKEGENATLPICHVTGYPIPVVTWSKVPGPLPRSRTVYSRGLVTLTKVTKRDTGTYQCSASNSLGTNSAFTALAVWSSPNFIAKPPSNISKFAKGSLSLNCTAEGDPHPRIFWKRLDGAWIEDRMKVQNGGLKISDLKETDSGNYVCEAKSPFFTIETRVHLEIKERKWLTKSLCRRTKRRRSGHTCWNFYIQESFGGEFLIKKLFYSGLLDIKLT